MKFIYQLILENKIKSLTLAVSICLFTMAFFSKDNNYEIDVRHEFEMDGKTYGVTESLAVHEIEPGQKILKFKQTHILRPIGIIYGLLTLLGVLIPGLFSNPDINWNLERVRFNTLQSNIKMTKVGKNFTYHLNGKKLTETKMDIPLYSLKPALEKYMINKDLLEDFVDIKKKRRSILKQIFN